MKRVALAVTVMVLVAVIGTWLDWRNQEKQKHVNVPGKTRPHGSTAAEIQGGPLTPQRQRMFAALACGQGLVTSDRGEMSCPVCPAGSDFATGDESAKDPGESAAPAGFDSGWTYGGMIFGHFTVAGAQEALLKTNGCESHANNMGGDVLLRKTGEQWSRVRYIHGGLVGDGCQRLDWEDGRDALVCDTGDMHQGIASDTAALFTIEPVAAAQDQNGDHTRFLTVSDDEGDCDEGAPKTTQSASIDRISLVAGANGRKDVQILASVGRSRLMATQDQCPVAAKKPYRLLFRNLGDHFVLAQGLPELQALQHDDCCTVETSAEVQPYRL